MLRRVDRILLRVEAVAAAAKYYEQTAGLTLIRIERDIAVLRLEEQDIELVLHNDDNLPAEGFYFLVDDVRDLFERRKELRLQFVGEPVVVGRGYRAHVRDPFGNVLLLLDRTVTGAGPEDARTPGTLFGEAPSKFATNKTRLAAIYSRIARTADDLPYTTHFEILYNEYIQPMPEPRPQRCEVWRQLLNMRKSGDLPRLGGAKSPAPEVDDAMRKKLRDLVGDDIGKRDRLPYTERFEQIVDDLNAQTKATLSPHQVWRLLALIAK